MSAPQITVEELLAEAERLSQRSAIQGTEGATCAELGERMGFGNERIRKILKVAIDNGMMECRHVPRRNMAGNLVRVPAYFPIHKKPDGKTAIRKVGK